jgi:hypothetical protein
MWIYRKCLKLDHGSSTAAPAFEPVQELTGQFQIAGVESFGESDVYPREQVPGLVMVPLQEP